jgi:hypothetical protein
VSVRIQEREENRISRLREGESRDRTYSNFPLGEGTTDRKLPVTPGQREVVMVVLLLLLLLLLLFGLLLLPPFPRESVKTGSGGSGWSPLPRCCCSLTCTSTAAAADDDDGGDDDGGDDDGGDDDDAGGDCCCCCGIDSKPVTLL